MHLKYLGVNDAFYDLVSQIYNGEILTVIRASRYGEVMMIEEPVTVTYSHPRERVLFNESRDCNPFFHLYESMWMLAGRNDVAPLAYYNSKMAEFSDDGKIFNGAYGYRWRHRFDYYKNEVKGFETSKNSGDTDQLKIIIDHLKNKPESRRAVLQMWNVEDDLLKTGTSVDVCCNTHVYFSIELGNCLLCNSDRCYQSGNAPQEVCPKCNGKPHDQPRYLNMTVCNRSNDLVWGMLGANVVHLSFLQEDIATQLGLEVGVYNQFTNNLHMYTETWKPEEWLRCYGQKERTMFDGPQISYEKSVKVVTPLISDVTCFDEELVELVERFSGINPFEKYVEYKNQFLRKTVVWMLLAFYHHKQRDYNSALDVMSQVRCDDWRIAGTNWITKRKERREKKSGIQTSTDKT